MDGLGNKSGRFNFYLFSCVLLSLLEIILCRKYPVGLQLSVLVSTALIMAFLIDPKIQVREKIIIFIFIQMSGILTYFLDEIGNININLIAAIYFVYLLLNKPIYSKHLKTNLVVFFLILYVLSQSLILQQSVSKASSPVAFATSWIPFLMITSFVRQTSIKEFGMILHTTFVILGFDLLFSYLMGPYHGELEFDQIFSLRVSGIAIHTNDFAAWYVIFFPFLLKVIIRNKFSLFLGYLFFIVTVLLSGSRFGLIGVVLNTFFFVIFQPGNGFIIFSIISILIFLLTGLDFSYQDFSLFQKLISDETQGDDVRFSKLNEFLEIFKTNPIFGVGHGNYQKYSLQTAGDGYNTHNTFISILTEYGIFGAMLFLMIILILFKKIYFIHLSIDSWKWHFHLSWVSLLAFGFVGMFQGTLFFSVYLGFVCILICDKNNLSFDLEN